ncbi:hypothetical protein PybrP1_010617 [[Pythium] brassicae (nom. inval.)]|nr:hypothetical protein PybrP1_010617 [[Pythium] brassicae (nom. inval.)]
MIQGFLCRLHFAIVKTHTTIQRAAIARAIIVPKDFVRSFVWESYQGRRRRAWMGKAQSELVTSNGGIGLPNLRMELETTAAAAVSRWACNAMQWERLIGDVLLERQVDEKHY